MHASSLVREMDCRIAKTTLMSALILSEANRVLANVWGGCENAPWMLGARP